MDLVNAQEAFVHLLGQLNPECKIEFLEWVHREYNPSVEPGNGITEEPESGQDLGVYKVIKRGISIHTEWSGPIRVQTNFDALLYVTEVFRLLVQDPFKKLAHAHLLDSIAADLKNTVHPNALAPGEPQFFPQTGPNSDLKPTNTLHVDSFLYASEEEVDSLCEQLQISRNYCLNCGSWKTSPLNFISHSVSREQLKFIFSDLLPNLNGKTVLDVGSRLGPVLYGGYAYSSASRLLGVEMNSYFCEVQFQVIGKYKMADRIQVICSDICNQASLLQEADVIILNNVFEFFCSPEDQARVWEFLYTTVRKHGTLIVAIPSIQESWEHIPIKATLQLDQWVRELATTASPEDDELSRIHLYYVL